MAKKKVLTLFTATAMAAMMTLSMTACGPSTPSTKDPEVTGIEVTTAPEKTHYVLGEKFDTKGMVVSKVYDNDTTEAIPATEYTYSPNTALKISDKKVTITWEEFTCDQKISVTNDIIRVDIITHPDKTEYIVGELFDPTGMTIQAYLEDGKPESDPIAVTSENVSYKTTGLAISDATFALNYGGFDFTESLVVNYGAALEAEAGLIISSGVKIADDGPTTSAIMMDRDNAWDAGNEQYRGLDEGGTRDDGNKINGGPRVNVKYYVHDQLELTETSGGHAVGSGRIVENHLEFSGSKNGTVLYSLTGEAAGTTDVIIKIANPNIDGSKATAIELNKVLEITVNGEKQNIDDSVKFADVDWSAYKGYNKETKEYNGDPCEPKFAWQNMVVTIPTVAGGNGIEIKSISDRTVRIDTISFKAQSSLAVDSAFAPEVVSAQLKVEGEKVLMGVIVDAKALGYSDDTVKSVLGNTKIGDGSGNATSDWTLGKSEWQQENLDPWTCPSDNGGLGYSDTPLSYKNSMNYNSEISKRAVVAVEKITTGDYAGMYYLWLDVTIPADAKASTPDKNRYVGVWQLDNFNYGGAYKSSTPSEDILKTGTNVTAELGDFCYQVYRDGRFTDQNAFGFGKLCIVIQYGSFTGDNPCPMLSRVYRDWVGELKNDKDIWDIHHPTTAE